jgi:predicted branched-subunit amino acid permease
MVAATAPSYPAWVGGTAIGVFAGDLISDPGAFGLDAIFPAFFLCLLVEGELRPGRPTLVAALGSLIALALIPFTPAGIPVITASAAALVGLKR